MSEPSALCGGGSLINWNWTSGSGWLHREWLIWWRRAGSVVVGCLVPRRCTWLSGVPDQRVIIMSDDVSGLQGFSI
jgi:hypothetical protein